VIAIVELQKMKWKNTYHNLCLKNEVYDELDKLRIIGENNSDLILRILSEFLNGTK